MKRNFWYALASILAFCSGVALVSCTDEVYDLGKGIDTDIMVGGDSLYLPLGSTERFTIKKLLENSPELVSIMKVREDGVYVLVPDVQENTMIVESIDPESLQIEDVVADSIIPLQSMAKASLPMQMDLNLDFVFTDLPESIIDLDYMTFTDETYFEFTLRFENLPSGYDVTRLVPSLQVFLPSFFVFPAGVMDAGEFSIESFSAEAGGYTQSWPLERLSLSEVEVGNQRMDFEALVSMAGSLVIPESDVADLRDLRAKVVCAVREINPLQVKGVFNPEVANLSMEASFGSVPQSLREEQTCLDFSEPYLLLNVRNSLDFLLETEVDLIPVWDGIRQDDKKQVLSLEMQPASLEGPEGQRFYLGADAATMPSGYTFVEADITRMLRHLPDELLVDVRANIDTTRSSTYTFGQDYEIVTNVEPVVPLVFGDSLYVSFCDTIGGLPDGLSEYMEGGELELYGFMHNSYPFSLTVEVQALDEDYQVLPLLTDGVQLIEAGAAGQAEESKVSFRFSDPEGLLEGHHIAAFRIECAALSDAETGGGSVKEDSYFEAALKLKKTGGIKIELASGEDDID